LPGSWGLSPPPDILLNLQANGTLFKRSPRQDYRYLHFAIHSDLPRKVQGVKEPFLFQDQLGNQEGHSGFFTLSKVLGPKLKAEMVVLSACLTGQGQVIEGEAGQLRLGLLSRRGPEYW